MIKEFFTVMGFQGSAWLIVTGLVLGAGAYNISNPSREPYKVDTTRAITYTGKGQFRCQTGC
jgi:hypothetical protein